VTDGSKKSNIAKKHDILTSTCLLKCNWSRVTYSPSITTTFCQPKLALTFDTVYDSSKCIF